MRSPITPKAALLQVLLQGPNFAFQLIALIAQRTGGVVRFQYGTVSPVLRELEAQGLVSGCDVAPAPGRGGRLRRCYQLTARGQRRALRQREAMAALFGGALATDAPAAEI